MSDDVKYKTSPQFRKMISAERLEWLRKNGKHSQKFLDMLLELPEEELRGMFKRADELIKKLNERNFD